MLTRLHITIILGLAVVVWAVALLGRGVPISSDHAWPFGITVSVLTILMLVFERVAWKWKIFKGWLVKRPNLQGTWHTVLQTSWRDPATGEPPGPIDCVMTIRQSLSTLSLRLFSKESSSFVLAHEIILQDDGVFQVSAVYQNNPKVHLRGDRSEIHYGALLLEVRGDPPTSLEGHYWTDRLTKGSLQLSNRSLEVVGNYEEGAELFGFS